ncbi:MAG: phage tail tape measure protein, partial [Proteobacteria bacterium]|nr:phage tail tape measure protein [Pseudomonadota bacterium]
MAAEGQNDIILNVSGNTRQLEREIQKVANNSLVLNTKGFSQPLGKITGQLGEFEKSLAASNARVIAFGASAGAIYALQRALAETVKSVISVEKSLIEINSILNVSEKNLTKFGNNLFEIAKNTGQSFNEVAKSALEFSRQGLTVEQTLKRTSDALILARLSGMDVVDSTNAITAALNSFNQTTISSTELVNKLVAVDAGFAVSSADLAEAIKRVGSSAQDVGVSLDELIAIVTSAQQTTARGGAVIGNSFKTIFTRVQRPKVLEALEQIGVKTRDLEGNMLPLMQILGDLSIKFDTLGGSQRAQIAELVGGVYQINILKAALGDLSKEFSIYNQALGISSRATNEAMSRNEEYNTSISAMLNKTINNLTKASSEIGNITLAPTLKKSLDLLNSGLESMSSDNGEYEGVGSTIGQGIAKGLGNFLSGPGLLFASAALIKVFERLTKYSYDAFKSLSGINAKSAEQQQLQAQILNLISRNPAIIEQINRGTLNTTSLHRDLLTYIQAETIAMEKQLAVANTLSKTLLQSGVRVPQSGDLKGLPVKQMKYFGFIPNFNYEEAETFGAAMGGYKAGKVKTMNIPKEGKVIYNDAESVVKMPGFSQPAIMPPEKSKAGENYKKTFEDKYGFNPYKYFGFIPNFNRERWMGPKGAVNPRTLQKGFTASAEELVYEKGWIRLSGKLAEEASLRRGQKVLSENNIQVGKLKNDEGDDVVFVKSATSDKVGDAQKVTNLLQGSLG